MGTRTRAGALLFLFLSLVVTGCRGGNVTSFRFKKDAESLQSMAEDGAITARSVTKGQATNAFTSVHAGELAEETKKLADVLGSAHPLPGLDTKTKQLVTLAREAAADLERLQHSPGNRPLARIVGSKLDKAAQQAQKLGKSV
jgi:hypothetical protein